MDLCAPTDEVVLHTKWFELVARRAPDYSDPHYSIQTLDYVQVVAVNPDGHLLLVRQFRPAVWETTLELPSGHVEQDQTPEEAARAELFEETGHTAEEWLPLGKCASDTGRLGNRLWCFFASNARPISRPAAQREAGIDFVLYEGTIRELVQEKNFSNGLNRAAILAAVMAGKLKL
jgi:8-oxo-dGTP pyrophosphatase MutT (NUDIX family)